MFIFGVIFIAFKSRLGITPPKKEKRYIDKKKARLCQILIITGLMIMVIVGIGFVYLSLLIPEEKFIDFFGWQTPIPWLYNILFTIGAIMAILGLIIGARGALEEIEQV